MKRSISTGKTVVALATALMALLLAAAPGGAATTLITNESGITADGLIDWGLLGGHTYMGSPTPSIGVTGISGLSVTASHVGNSGFFWTMVQGPNWGGNFGSGEQLLYTTADAPSGPITLQFNYSVAGVGAQIQAAFYGAFTASIEAFDASNLSLGYYTLPGVSNSLGNDSAIFIGILSNSADIAKVVFGVPVAPFARNQEFAINGPRVQTAPVPEPSTMLLLGSGLAGLVRYGRRRLKK